MSDLGELVEDVDSPHEFVRIAGHHKFLAKTNSFVMYRGHGSIYSSCLPSGARDVQAPGLKRLSDDMREYVDTLVESPCTCGEWSCATMVPNHQSTRGSGLISQTPRAAVEPLLQHFGLKTRWVDTVDNIWVALWFACHRFEVDSHTRRYAYYRKRSPAQEQDGYAYVSVIDSRPVEPVGPSGCYQGDAARVVDLRLAAPSIYLRPHAQHGMLIATNDWVDPNGLDLAPLHKTVMRIRLVDALDWLGDGTMLRPFVLFPPAAIDHGYRALLEFAPDAPDRLGKILLMGPGN